MTAPASVVVPVGLLNEAAGLLELEGYGPVSMGLLACLPQPAEQDAREAVDPIDERTGHPTSYSNPLLTQAAPDGWRLVPVEPTPEMTHAGKMASAPASWHYLNITYRAMLSASPAPPAQGAGG